MLRQLDSKIIGYLKSGYISSPADGFRSRIVFSYVASFFILMTLNINHAGYSKIIFSAISFFFFVHAVYFWRTFFILRREGSNLNEPLFFVEPASLFRKWLFLLSIVTIIYSFVSPMAIPSLLSCEWLHRMTHFKPNIILLSFSLAVVSVEFGRVVTTSWSEQKHFVVLFIVAFAILIFMTQCGYHDPHKLLLLD